MEKPCPEFELLSRFHDGALDAAEEEALLVHIAGCEACRAALASLEEADALLTVGLATPAPATRRFRSVRPALLPLAAALIFALTLGYVLVASPGAADSPIEVAEMTPASVTPLAEPVANVFLQDRFESGQLHPVWKGTDATTGTSTLVHAEGRKALQLSAFPGGRKRGALLTAAHEFPVARGVSFDVDYRIPKPQKGGRLQLLFHTKSPKIGRGVLRWSRTHDEEILEAQADGRSKTVVLWSSKGAPVDSGWHQVKVTLTSADVVLHRDGVETVRKPHGLPLERLALTLGCTMDKRSRDPHEPFECQVGRVVVLGEESR